MLEGRGIGMSQTYYLEEAVRAGELVHVLPDHHLGEYPILPSILTASTCRRSSRSFLDFAARHFAEHPKWQQPGMAAARRSAA